VSALTFFAFGLICLLELTLAFRSAAWLDCAPFGSVHPGDGIVVEILYCSVVYSVVTCSFCHRKCRERNRRAKTFGFRV
jgi:hypothetical protein